jgi:hypothetical protein
MGEQKRRAERMTHHDRVVQELTRKLVAEGRLIEAGWMGLYALWVPEDAPPQQVLDLRKAFMAGAQHLWGSIMTMLDPGSEMSAADLSRMQQIQAELDAFGAELARDHYPTKGTA